MIKFSSKIKFNLIFLLILLATISLPGKSFAQTKIDYYRDLFSKEFGFDVYKFEDLGNYSGDLSLGVTDSSYFVVLTSSLKNYSNSSDTLDNENKLSEEQLGYFSYLEKPSKKFIIVCDSDFYSSFPLNYSCNNDTVRFGEGSIVNGILKTDKLLNMDVYVIPENYLLSPDRKTDLKEYIKAIVRSDSVSTISEDAKIEEEVLTLEQRTELFLRSPTFSFFSIALYMIILVSLFSGILRVLGREDRRPFLTEIKNIFSKGKMQSEYRKIVLLVLVWLIFIYLIFMASISIKDGQGYNLNYIISYSLDSLDIRRAGFYASDGSYLNLLVFLYESVIFSLIVALFIPKIIQILKIFSIQFSKGRLKDNFIKYSLPVTILLSILISAFFDIADTLDVILVLIVLISFIFIKKPTFRFDYSPKEKTILMLLATLILMGGFSYKFLMSRIPPRYKKEDLIGISGEVVLLPYNKKLGENIIIDNHLFSGSEPLFVDHYLIYSPNYSRIENKSASEFKKEGVFLIQNGEVIDIIRTVQLNENLSDELISVIPTNLFRLRNFNIMGGQNFIEIEFSCSRLNLETNDIKAEYYFTENGEVKYTENTLLYFPGCIKIGEPVKIKSKLNLPYSDSEYVYIRLLKVLGADIKSIRVTSEDEYFEPVYLVKSRGCGVIDSGGLENSVSAPITNYIFGESYDLSFDMTLDEEGKFDISIPINELIKKGILKDQFLIWSTKKYLPVRLPD